MKKSKKIIITVVLALLLSAMLVACGETEAAKTDLPEWEWGVTASGTAYVKAYNGTAKSVNVPSINDDKEVTEIGEGAFSGNTTMMNVNLPSSVTSIRQSAFKGCEGLRNFIISENMTNLEERAFSSCPNLKTFTVSANNEKYALVGNSVVEKETKTLLYSTTSTKIPTDGSVLAFGAYAFEGNKNVTKVKTENGDDNNKTTVLTEIVVPLCLQKIGTGAFASCPNLKTAELPETLSSVGTDVFKGCPLENVVLTPEELPCLTKDEVQGIELIGAQSVGKEELNDFTALKTLVIPDSVTEIAAGALYGCGALESITLPFVGGREDAADKTKESMFGYIFGRDPYDGGRGTSQLADMQDGKEKYYLFYLPKNLKTVNVHGYRVPYGSFFNCKSLQTINLVQTQEIGDYAFMYCSALQTVFMNDSMQKMGVQAFYQCTELDKVYVERIQVGGTSDEDRLKQVVKAWCEIEFANNYSNPVSYAKKIYFNDVLCTNLTVPEGTTAVKSYAFYNATCIETVSLPETLNFIGDYAFHGCTGIRTVDNKSSAQLKTE